MTNWFKQLSLIITIFTIFIVMGCSPSIEMPLSKEEASQLTKLDVEASPIEKANQDEVLNKNPEKTKTESTETQGKDSNSNNEENSSSTMEQSPASNFKSETNSENEKTKPESTSNENITKSENKADTNRSAVKNENNKPKSTTGKENSTPSDKKNSDKKQDSTETEPTPSPSNTIVYSIVISEETDEIPLSPTEMEIEEGDTVLDALINITMAKSIQMDYRGGQGATAYVEGIANVYEFDRGQGSGWMYRVNGIFPDRGAGVVPLLPGDRVEWLYTTDLGVDLGANLQPFRR